MECKYFTEKVEGLREELRTGFIDLVKTHGLKYGNGWELFTFDICSEEGFMLAGSTIDKIEVYGESVLFYYDLNTKDYDSLKSFDVQDLAEFFDSFVTYFYNRKEEEE